MKLIKRNNSLETKGAGHMKVIVLAKNMKLTPSLKEAVEKKLSKLDKYFSPDVEAKATLSVQKGKHKIEVTIPFNGVILRCEESTEDMYKSIDIIEDKVERQIRKQKTKLQRRNSNESVRYLNFDNIEGKGEDDNSTVVKTKKFLVKPMLTDEAILQMELVGHSFYVYKDAETNDVRVLYKRKDGNYGLIEPEFK